MWNLASMLRTVPSQSQATGTRAVSRHWAVRTLLATANFVAVRTSSSFRCLLQSGVFRPGLVDNWQMGVGVLPDREDILVSSLGFGRVA